jgi:hypothetical protein
MRKVSVLAAAGLLLLTAGCVQDGYPSYGYGYSPGYYNSGYYGRPVSYSRPAYYSRPVYYSSPSYRHHRHWKRDRNRDGVPDRYQRRW